MTNFVSPVSPVEEVREVLHGFETGFFMPLAKNLTAGAAVGAIAFLSVIAYMGISDANPDLYNVAIWCALIGGIPACLLTVVCFWGDEIGLIITAYQSGRADEQAKLMPRIAALELELSAAYDAQSAYEENGATAAIKKNQEIMERARKDAAHILKIAFQGDKVTRAAMEQRGMGRHDFDRARNLLKAAGAMNGEGFIVATTPAQALQAIDEQFNADAQQGDNFATKW